MINKLKEKYYSLLTFWHEEDDSDEVFLKFLDSLYNLFVVCFLIFGSISMYFFATRVLL